MITHTVLTISSFRKCFVLKSACHLWAGGARELRVPEVRPVVGRACVWSAAADRDPRVQCHSGQHHASALTAPRPEPHGAFEHLSVCQSQTIQGKAASPACTLQTTCSNMERSILGSFYESCLNGNLV